MHVCAPIGGVVHYLITEEVMRIKVILRNRESSSFLPVNTNFYLSQVVQSLIRGHEKYLASLLPYNGISPAEFDFFTFSQLMVPKRRIEANRLFIQSRRFSWSISSPFPQFLAIVRESLVRRRAIRIAGNRYEVASVQYLPEQRFEECRARFTCLSPVTVMNDRNALLQGKQTLDNFVLPEQRQFVARLEEDITFKYNLLRKTSRRRIEIGLQLDYEYLRKHHFKVWKLIALENHTDEHDYVRGFLAPFQVQAEPDVLNLIYDTGLGQFNRMGFGMIERVEPATTGLCA